MARKRKTKSDFWSVRKGVKNVGAGLVQAGKELSTIPAYAVRGGRKKPRCKLKKGWFE